MTTKVPQTTTKKRKDMGLLKGQHPDIGSLERAEARARQGTPGRKVTVYEDGSVKVKNRPPAPVKNPSSKTPWFSNRLENAKVSNGSKPPAIVSQIPKSKPKKGGKKK